MLRIIYIYNIKIWYTILRRPTTWNFRSPTQQLKKASICLLLLLFLFILFLSFYLSVIEVTGNSLFVYNSKLTPQWK